MTEADRESPLLRLADFHDLAFLRARVLNLPTATSETLGNWRFTVPVRSLEHPLVVTGERSSPGTGSARPRRQRFVALAFGATDSVELPLRVAFPLFIRNTLAWVAGQRRSRRRRSTRANALRAGERLRLAAGETLWTVPQREYQALPGVVLPAETLAGPAIFQPERNGYYLRRGADGTTRWLAVNTFDRETSAMNEPAGHWASERAFGPETKPSALDFHGLVGNSEGVATVDLSRARRVGHLRVGMVGLPPPAHGIRNAGWCWLQRENACSRERRGACAPGGGPSRPPL